MKYFRIKIYLKIIVFFKSLIINNYDQKKIDQLERKVTDKVFDINNSSHFMPKESLLCEWCFFWEECETRIYHFVVYHCYHHLSKSLRKHCEFCHSVTDYISQIVSI